MVFQPGNEYWKKRSKHGRDRIIKSSEVLYKAAQEYFKWCEDNPVYEIDYRGKDLQEVRIPHPRAFKKEEFARFCGISQWRLITDLKKVSDDFSQIIDSIEQTIADQKYQYAVVNMFNSNIVARDLGLKDKQDITTDNRPIDYSSKSTDELIRRAEALNKLENEEKQGED